MKQTAVEQFIEQLEQQGDSWENASIGRINISIKVEDYLKLIQQAKEMEKENTIDFAETCLQNNSCFFDIEEHYNKTFKSE
jgi:hypothetical protein